MSSLARFLDVLLELAQDIGAGHHTSTLTESNVEAIVNEDCIESLALSTDEEHD